MVEACKAIRATLGKVGQDWLHHRRVKGVGSMQPAAPTPAAVSVMDSASIAALTGNHRLVSFVDGCNCQMIVEIGHDGLCG